MVTFVPYPTSVLAAYLKTPAAKMAMVFYSGTFVLITISFYLLIRAGFRRKLLAPAASIKFVDKTCRNYMFGPPLYLISTVAAFVDVRLSLLICTTLVVGGHQFPVFNPQIGDVRGQTEFLAILGRIQQLLDGGFQRGLWNG
jgi:hypothetical protein